MKKIILLTLCIMFVYGCHYDGTNPIKLRNAIVTDMKTTDVYDVGGWKYVVRTNDGSVWVVECMAVDAKITAKTLVFSPLK